MRFDNTVHSSRLPGTCLAVLVYSKVEHKTFDGVEDHPLEAEGGHGDTDDNLEQPLAPGGQGSGVTHVDVPRVERRAVKHS